MAESSLEVTRVQTFAPEPRGEGPGTPTPHEEPATVAPEAGVLSTLPAGREHLPQVLGYEILERLGHGGMGVVYRARHLRLNRLVALKMIRDGVLATEEQLARFYAEARAVAKLQHPNIVQIYEIGEQQGRPYFALELVEGGNLAQKLAVLPLPAPEAAQLVRTLARAMHHAHQQGIIHRDLKPANVLLTREGQAKITDFGLAKELEAEVFLTHSRSGLLMGTPSYMAPEQARGTSRQIGPAADVYGLGAILYEALTGHPPFVSQSLLEVLEQVRSQEPLSPTRRQRQCPRDLEVICLKCLRKEPGQRYATAAELADDLERHLRSEPIRARPAGVWERGLKWMRRHPTALSIVVAGLLLTAGAGVAVQYFRQQADEVAQGKRDRDEFRKDQYPLQLARAEQSAAAGNWSQTRKLLEECHPERRGWEWRYLQGLCGGRGSVEYRAHNDGVFALAFHPTAARLASGGQDGIVHVWDLRLTRNNTQYDVRSNTVTSLAFSPGGNRLAIALGPPLQREVVPAPANNKPTPKEATTPADADGADGDDKAARERSGLDSLLSAEAATWFVAWKEEKRPVNPLIAPQQAKVLRPAVLVWDLRTRQELFTLPEQSLPVIAAAFTPDGKYLATATGVLLSIPFPPPEREPLAPAPPGPPLPGKGVSKVRSPQGPPWGEAGRATEWVVMEDINARQFQPAVRPPEPGRLTLWDARTGKEFRSVQLESPILGMAIHPREPILAAACEDGKVRLWDYRAGTTRALNGHERRVRSVAFNRTGDILASGGQDATVRLWDPIAATERFVLRDHTSDILELAFSSDGERLVSASADRTIKVWDPARGQHLLTLRGHRGTVVSVVFGADGRYLVSGDTEGILRVWEVPPEGSEEEPLVDSAIGQKDVSKAQPEPKKMPTAPDTKPAPKPPPVLRAEKKDAKPPPSKEPAKERIRPKEKKEAK